MKDSQKPEIYLISGDLEPDDHRIIKIETDEK
jgi:hypothetical protein